MHSENTAIEEPAAARGAVAIITNRRGEVLLHLRDDLSEIAWAAHWSVLGGGCDPGESPADAIVRELDEEAGLIPDDLLRRHLGRRRDGPAEGVKLQFFAPDYLDILTIPPFIRDGIHRYLAAGPS
ncbi:hypothetical protein GCM10010302_17340 [Streptomyces polychromogenes]|uniref:Nudix hydrolase domain-containing protein n=1 Tax=Streptomyces polychromogenes TaxID=67342 RepID=A0ABP3EX57_9ACTN